MRTKKLRRKAALAYMKAMVKKYNETRTYDEIVLESWKMADKFVKGRKKKNR